MSINSRFRQSSLSILKFGFYGLIFWSIVLGPFYLAAILTGLPGMSGGPQDAFRHTFASAVIAKTISPSVVDLVTHLFERNDNSPLDQMDRHNNRIGRDLGAKGGSLKEIYEAVLALINQGAEEPGDLETIVWLPEDQWSTGL